jgi:hypothetical protein
MRGARHIEEVSDFTNLQLFFMLEVKLLLIKHNENETKIKHSLIPSPVAPQ